MVNALMFLELSVSTTRLSCIVSGSKEMAAGR